MSERKPLPALSRHGRRCSSRGRPVKTKKLKINGVSSSPSATQQQQAYALHDKTLGIPPTSVPSLTPEAGSRVKEMAQPRDKGKKIAMEPKVRESSQGSAKRSSNTNLQDSGQAEVIIPSASTGD